MSPPVGKNAVALIVAQEIGSAALYEKEYQSPVWPGGASGATVGIGYDLGQHTSAQIAADWGTYLDPATVALMCDGAGVTGQAAHAKASALRAVRVPLVIAQQVFALSTLPRYAKGTDDALDNCDQIPPDAFGALVSISYNRGYGGWDMDDDRHTEMADISDAMTAAAYTKVPGLIRAMQRLWAHGSDLWERRGLEADLFAKSLLP